MWNAWNNRETYRILMGTPVGNRLFERPKRGWNKNIEIDVKEMCVLWEGEDWINVAQERILTRNQTCGFYKILPFFIRLAGKTYASLEGLCSAELVSYRGRCKVGK